MCLSIHDSDHAESNDNILDLKLPSRLLKLKTLHEVGTVGYWQAWCCIVDELSSFSTEAQVHGERFVTILALFLREGDFLAGCAAVVDSLKTKT